MGVELNGESGKFVAGVGAPGLEWPVGLQK